MGRANVQECVGRVYMMHTGTNHRAPCRGGAPGALASTRPAGLRARLQLTLPGLTVRRKLWKRADFTVADTGDAQWL